MTVVDVDADDRRALAHILGRTRQGAFACRLWDWDERRWLASVSRLSDEYPIRWVFGRVADEPSVTGGYVIDGLTPREEDQS